MKPKLVIFDVDGTLLDTEARWYEAWERVGEKYGYENLGQKTFLKCVGLTGKDEEEIVRNDFKELENPLALLEEVISLGKELLEERIDVKPGAFELLERLKEKKIPIAVATTTFKEATYRRLTKTKLIHYFNFILCGDEVVNRKPHPEIYLTVLNHFNMDAKDALVLEDSVVGVEAAYRAHIPCIMVPDLKPATQKQESETIAVVSSLHDVINLLD